MKYQDINNRYTEIISQYMAQGYTINTSTMSGSQGEIAKIDLTDGTEIIRIYIDTFHEWEDYYDLEGYEIVIGKSTDNIPANREDRYGTVWSTHLEIISSERFYAVGRDRGNGKFFTGRDEALNASKIRSSRYVSRNNTRSTVNLTDKAMDIAKRIIRNKFGVKRIIESDVKISKYKNKYTVSYRGKAYALH